MSNMRWGAPVMLVMVTVVIMAGAYAATAAASTRLHECRGLHRGIPRVKADFGCHRARRTVDGSTGRYGCHIAAGSPSMDGIVIASIGVAGTRARSVVGTAAAFGSVGGQQPEGAAAHRL